MAILSVTQLNRYVGFKLKEDRALQSVLVRGEITNFTNHYRSGHLYFTLRDAESCVKAVMFRSHAQRLKFLPQEGMNVIAAASAALYERDGAFQIYVTDLQPDGTGGKALALEQLKKKLTAMGVFDAASKRPLPAMPKKIGVITSDTGAALQDVKNVIGRRYPIGHLLVYPAQVQGDAAAASVCRAIAAAERDSCDVLIVGRGGGASETLEAFNTEQVVMAIYNCTVPVVSAVGHETDWTLADAAADLRAPTPSAAAELAVTQVSDIENEILDRQDRLYQRMGRVLQHKRQQADQMEMRLKYLSPASRIREKRTYSIQLEDRLQNRLQAILRERRHNLALYIERMKAVSPLEKLNSGFSYVEDTDGKNIRSVTQVEAGERLRIRMSDGVIDTRVEQIQKEERLPG